MRHKGRDCRDSAAPREKGRVPAEVRRVAPLVPATYRVGQLAFQDGRVSLEAGFDGLQR